ncbi:MAG: ribosome-associated translation inhibitor RaiA [Planctomycetes bacterium]|nr:ribosome-associated translation inhibitor RaiA [Planctomycetota bacterium]
MKVTITVRHENLDEASKSYAREKTEGLSHFFERITKINMILDGKGAFQYVEIIASIPRGATLVSHAKNKEVKSAIDEAVLKMEHQLSKLKSKIIDKHHGKK